MTSSPKAFALGASARGNVAEAEKAENAALEPVQRHDRWRLPAAGLHQLVGERDLAGHREQQRHRVVGDLAQAIVRHIGDGDAERCRGRQVDVVDAEAEPADHLAALELFEEIAGELGIGDEHRVGVARHREDVVGGRRFRHPQLRIDALERGDRGIERVERCSR